MMGVGALVRFTVTDPPHKPGPARRGDVWTVVCVSHNGYRLIQRGQGFDRQVVSAHESELKTVEGVA